MDQAIAHKYSKGIRQAKKRYVTLSIMLPIILIIFLFLNPTTKDLSPIEIAGIGLFTFVVAGLTFYFSASRVLKGLSKLSVYIFPDKLERIAPENKEEFLWKDLLRVEILKYPNGEIVSINLVFADKKRVTLFGFENMEMAKNQIVQYIPDKGLIHQKQVKINWGNPVSIILTSVITMVIFLAIQESGEKASSIFNFLFSFSLGLYFLIARPISRAQGQSWKKFETIMSVFLIISSIFLLALLFGLYYYF